MPDVVEAEIPDEPFSSRLAAAVLKEACAHARIDPAGARLMRLGENALFHLPQSSIVVRIARNQDHWDDAVKEVAVANWLAENDMPAARVYDVAQPVSISGYPATFWHYIEGRNGAREDVGALGELLLLDEAGLTARQIADVLGHARPSMTQDVYMGRRAPGRAAADALGAVIDGDAQK